MDEIHSEPLKELKNDIKQETLKKVKKSHVHSKSLPPTVFPSLLSMNYSVNSTSPKSSKELPESANDILSMIQKNVNLSSLQNVEKNAKKNIKSRFKDKKILFKLISQEEADIYTEEAMLNLGYLESDLEYATKDEINSFTNNPYLINIVKDELNAVVDERKKKLEVEKRNIYFNYHLKKNSIFLIHSKKSPKKNQRRNLFYDDIQTKDQSDLNLSYGNGYNCSVNFQKAVNDNEDKIRRVVSQHKKVVTKAVFDALKTHYQSNKDKEANERYTEKMNKTQNLNSGILEKNHDRYMKVKKEKRIEINKKKQKLKEKSAKDESRLNKLYNDRLNRSVELHVKNEIKAQRAAEVREENLLRSIDEMESSCSSNATSPSTSETSSVSNSALVPQSSNKTSQENSPNKASQSNQKNKKKEPDELDLELHPEEPYSSTQVIKMMAMNKIIEKEAKAYGRLAKFEEARQIKKVQAQKEFERKQKVIAQAREKQENDRLKLQERNERRMRQSEQRIDVLANDYRKFLIKRSATEAETAVRIKKMRSADLKARRKKADEMVEKEKIRMMSFTEMKQEKCNEFEERKLMEDLRQSRAQKERQIFDRKEEARKRARERKFRRNQEERKELLNMENEYLRSYENKIDQHISDFESIFSSQMERAKTDPDMLGKLVNMYNVDVDEIDASAKKASSNAVPLNEYIENLKDAKNDFDIKTAKDIMFETTHVRIDPKDDQSESYIYSDYNSSIESDAD